MNSPKVLRSLIVVFTLVTALVHLWLVYNGAIHRSHTRFSSMAWATWPSWAHSS